MVIVVIAFVAGAVIWQMWSSGDDDRVAMAPSVSGSQAAAATVEKDEPLLLARQDQNDNNPDHADNGQSGQPVLTPLDQPLAAAPDGTPSFFFCFEGKLPETRLLVVDKSRQRLMVLRYMGEMVLEYEFPCATGSNEGSKQLEGDARTPVGIYFTTHRYEDNKMSVFGYRAIHLDYPNAFDMDQSRNGQGIYIHGTNQDLKPRSSNGCVAMRNEDIARIEELIKEQVTPVVVVESLSLPELNQRIRACDWLRYISLDKLSATTPRMGNGLGLLNPPSGFHYSKQPSLDMLGEKIWLLAQAKDQVKSTTTTGMSIFGLGDHWVLAANQVLRIGQQDYNITKRFYLEGSDPRQANLVRTSWVLDNQAQARTLAQMAPPPVLTVAVNNNPPPPPSPPEVKPETIADQPLANAEKPAHTPQVSVSQSPPSAEAQLQKTLKDWLSAWSSKNLNAYMTFYAASFKSDKGQDYAAWKSHKANLFRTYKTISARASNVVIKVRSENRAEIIFTQHYRSDWHKDTGVKTLDLILQNGRWLIVKESWYATN